MTTLRFGAQRVLGLSLAVVLTGCFADSPRSAAAAAAASATSAASAAPTPRGTNAEFSFAVVGDMPYGQAEQAPFERLIAEVNADPQVQLVVHLGDVKAGSEPCDDAFLLGRLQQIRTFRSPVVYTPGDNEWTDCHRTGAGRFVPTERLAFLRQHFFADPTRALGEPAFPLIPQSATPGFETFVENALFVKSGVVFATVHVVGSGNNLEPWSGIDGEDSVRRPRADRLAEFKAREAAALAWLDRAFDEAAARNAAGVFIAWQANPEFERAASDARRAGFNAVIERLKTRALAFGKPVLLAQGDHHELIIDQPLARPAEPAPPAPNVTRLQGYGSPHVHWVKVHVNPKSAQVFELEPMRVKGNR